MSHKNKVFLIGLLAMVLLWIVAPAYAAEDVGPPVPPVYIDLTAIVQALLALLAGVITVKVVPWVKARTSTQQQDLLTSTMQILVYAAEQIYGSNSGQLKLDYVENELRRRGFTIDRDAIEAAVREMNMSGQLLSGLEVVDIGPPIVTPEDQNGRS